MRSVVEADIHRSVMGVAACTSGDAGVSTRYAMLTCAR